jgi:hypothetical protein
VRKSPVSATRNAEGSRARVEPIASAPVVDLRLQRRQSASFHGNISADGAFNFEPPGKNPSMRHVKVCSACGKPESVASVTCLWCGQPKKLFSGRLAAMLKAVLSGIGFLLKRGGAVRS